MALCMWLVVSRGVIGHGGRARCSDPHVSLSDEGRYGGGLSIHCVGFHNKDLRAKESTWHDNGPSGRRCGGAHMDMFGGGGSSLTKPTLRRCLLALLRSHYTPHPSHLIWHRG